MSNWSSQEVKMIESHGNEVAAALYLAKWDRERHPKPEASQNDKIRDFMQRAFLRKSWMDKSAKPAKQSTKKPASRPSSQTKSPQLSGKSSTSGGGGSTTQKLSDVVPGASVTVKKKTIAPESKPEAAKAAKSASNSGKLLDIGYWGDSPAPAPKAAAPAPAAESTDDAWANDWSFSSAPGDTAFAAARGPAPAPIAAPPSSAPAPAAPAPAPAASLFDAFAGDLAGLSMGGASEPEKAKPPAPAAPKENPMGAANSNISDAFAGLGNMYNPQPARPTPPQHNPYAQPHNPYGVPPRQYQQHYPGAAVHNQYQPRGAQPRPYAAAGWPGYQQQQPRYPQQQQPYGAAPVGGNPFASPAASPQQPPRPAVMGYQNAGYAQYGGGGYGGVPRPQQPPQQQQQFANPFASPQQSPVRPPASTQMKTPFDDF